MLHLHLGIKPVDLNMFFRELHKNGIRPIIDGDGWNAWGESVGANGNDADTLHIIIPAENKSTVNKVLTFVPPLVSSKQGRTWVLTTKEDWSVDVSRWETE